MSVSEIQAITAAMKGVNVETMLNTLMARRGQIVTMQTVKSCKVRKGQAEVLKFSEFQARVGVNYENMAKVKEGRADGTLPEENQGLPWGEWEIFPYVIKHKGERYFRFTSLDSGFKRAPRYFQNGVEITKEAAQAACLASEFPKDGDEKPLVFTFKIASILGVK